MARKDGSVVWRNFSLNHDVAAALRAVLTTGAYPVSFDSEEEGEEWSQLKRGYDALVKRGVKLPAIAFPDRATIANVQRAKDVMAIYRFGSDDKGRAGLSELLNVAAMPFGELCTALDAPPVAPATAPASPAKSGKPGK